MKTIASLVAVSLVLAGCATASKDIVATSSSPLQYQNLDCTQIQQELTRVTNRANDIGARLDTAAQNDKAIAGVALLLFWPAAFALGGTKGQEAEYANLKGQADALQQAAIAKKCAL